MTNTSENASPPPSEEKKQDEAAQKMSDTINAAYANSPLVNRLVNQIGGMGKETYSRAEMHAAIFAASSLFLKLDEAQKVLLQATTQLQTMERAALGWASIDKGARQLEEQRKSALSGLTSTGERLSSGSLAESATRPMAPQGTSSGDAEGELEGSGMPEPGNPEGD